VAYLLKPQYEQGPEARQWLAEQFEWEDCAECGRGARGHVAVEAGMGPFALCWPTARTRELSPTQLQVFTKESSS
jgi:hypothetical protein